MPKAASAESSCTEQSETSGEKIFDEDVSTPSETENVSAEAIKESAEASEAAKEEIVEETVAETAAAAESEMQENVSQYTYIDSEQKMYAAQAVNVRNLPSTDGDKVGGFSYSQEVIVTGQCNETGWYRMDYNGQEAFVSNKYLLSEKPVSETPATETEVSSVQASVSGDNSSSGNGSQSSSASVTVPSQEETMGNLV